MTSPLISFRRSGGRTPGSAAGPLAGLGGTRACLWALVVAGFPVVAQPAPNAAAAVLVVVNDASPLSRDIGEYYVQRRSIPMGNVCHIRTTREEEIDRAAYSSQVAKPIADCLQTRKLVEQILYVVTTAGVPLRIAGKDGVTGDLAAVDSELTLLYYDMHNKTPHPLDGPFPNPFFGKTGVKFSHAEFPFYMVTRLAAYDLMGVKALIDRALVARNIGKVVIDLKSHDDEDGNNWLRSAALLIPKDRLIFDETERVLYGQTNVIGYASWGSNDPNRHQRFVGFQWLPGAIATEFVSTNGRTFDRPPKDWTLSDWKTRAKWWRGAPQSLTADYLEEGASAATGHVEEPYLRATPHPEFLFPAYLTGRNLAESFYLSIPALSWQNIVVGDPLMSLR